MRKDYATVQLLRIANTLSGAIETVVERVGKATIWLIPLMVLVGAWNAFGRFVGQALGTNLTSNLLVEMQWYGYALVFLLGGAYTFKQNGHVRVDVLYSTWSPRTKALVNLLGTIFFLIPFCIFVIYFSWDYVMVSWAGLEQSPDPSGLPRYPIKSMILVGYGLLLLQGIAEGIKNLQHLAEPTTPPEESA